MSLYCPDCESSRIWRKSKSRNESKDGKWACKECLVHFNDPIRKEATNGVGGGLAQELLDADPEKWP